MNEITAGLKAQLTTLKTELKNHEKAANNTRRQIVKVQKALASVVAITPAQA
jgi:hypothetical protein